MYYFVKLFNLPEVIHKKQSLINEDTTNSLSINTAYTELEPVFCCNSEQEASDYIT